MHALNWNSSILYNILNNSTSILNHGTPSVIIVLLLCLQPTPQHMWITPHHNPPPMYPTLSRTLEPTLNISRLPPQCQAPSAHITLSPFCPLTPRTLPPRLPPKRKAEAANHFVRRREWRLHGKAQHHPQQHQPYTGLCAAQEQVRTSHCPRHCSSRTHLSRTRFYALHHSQILRVPDLSQRQDRHPCQQKDP